MKIKYHPAIIAVKAFKLVCLKNNKSSSGRSFYVRQVEEVRTSIVLVLPIVRIWKNQGCGLLSYGIISL
jgi:hypothetical protein